MPLVDEEEKRFIIFCSRKGIGILTSLICRTLSFLFPVKGTRTKKSSNTFPEISPIDGKDKAQSLT